MHAHPFPRAAPLLSGALCLVGCAPGPMNPSFAVTPAGARADLARMRADARPALRPIVVIGGYADPGIAAPTLARRLRACFTDANIIAFQPAMIGSMDAARDRLLAKVRAAFASTDPTSTIEVDVVAISMGGLIARHATLPRENAPRLRIATLYTLASPHRGANLAAMPAIEPRIADMRAGSGFLARLDAAPRDFPIVPYGRLGDLIVGVENTAPPGQTTHWVPTPALQAAHAQVYADPRILADIARRMRAEQPLAKDPAAPLPTRSSAPHRP
ncbi:MAG TPA: hypothetical protein PKE29_14215 [Phycisphaerales bacterium]|nr:hypothetical protein [Phycisphaerales bacterium]